MQKTIREGAAALRAAHNVGHKSAKVPVERMRCRAKGAWVRGWAGDAHLPPMGA